MNKTVSKDDVFSKLPIKRATLMQILPSIASQMVALIYGFADTFFVGRLNDPDQTAAVTVSTSVFLLLTALSNLFGIGGASVIARALGVNDRSRAEKTSAFSFYAAAVGGLLFSAIVAVFRSDILMLCGAKGKVVEYAGGYVFYTVILGSIPTVLTNTMANLVRAEGSAGTASFGVTLGCILNIILDPIFVLPNFLNMGAAGAGLATAISNAAGMLFFLSYVLKNRRDTVVKLSARNLKYIRETAGDVLKIGSPSALQYLLTVVGVSTQMNFVSKYGNDAVAGLGITKKLDQLPLYFSIGIANGLLPLIGYNYAAGNHERTEKAFRFGCTISLCFAVLCVIAYEIFARPLAGFFIDDAETVNYAASFLRRMVLAMPFMSICYPMIVKFQAMGKAKESLIVSVLRKGVIDIPLYFITDSIVPLYGCMWVQPIVDTVSLMAALFLNFHITKTTKQTIPEH